MIIVLPDVYSDNLCCILPLAASIGQISESSFYSLASVSHLDKGHPLYEGTLTLARAAQLPWSPSRHWLHPAGTRLTVLTVMLIRNPGHWEGTALARLPLPVELWWHILGYLCRKSGVL